MAIAVFHAEQKRSGVMADRIRFFLNRARERLWVRPLMFCILSLAGAFLAKMVDNKKIGQIVPEINPESIETLLAIIAASMLVISTFAVASMLSKSVNFISITDCILVIRVPQFG